MTPIALPSAGGLLTFALVFVRTSAMLAVAPMLTGAGVTPRWRLAAAFTLAVLVAPLQAASSASMPANALDTLHACAAEAVVGLALGAGAGISLAGIRMAGQLLAQAGGLQLGEMIDPEAASGGGLAPLVPTLAIVAFVTTGGHRLAVAAVLDTFIALPLGQGLSGTVVESLTNLLTQSCDLGLRAAAPIAMAVILATVLVGVISRTLPQLNVLAVGLGLNAMVALGTLVLAMGSVTWVFQEQLAPMWQAFVEAIVRK